MMYIFVGTWAFFHTSIQGEMFLVALLLFRISRDHALRSLVRTDPAAIPAAVPAVIVAAVVAVIAGTYKDPPTSAMDEMSPAAMMARTMVAATVMTSPVAATTTS